MHPNIANKTNYLQGVPYISHDLLALVMKTADWVTII